MNVLLIAAISVDGRIAKVSDQLADWTSKEDKRFFVSKTKESGVLIMGRKTYDTIGRPLPNRLNIVMTRDFDASKNIEGLLEYTQKSPCELIADLQSRGYESVVIGGGASIYSTFLREGLVTDLYLTVESLLFGSGVSIVDDIDKIQLDLQSVEKIGEQSVLLHYKIL
ncbi:dihydrofolate reductase family protein [Patescibacteria group bacterium]|nr:dihydrofolate reductase family protein [Patescibacteria group bacterium]MBU4453014.1 dihydrofolate reductase family protein [Patescibacteria group bacterium]MCG2687825.1 dihydrofolate reductase family protein [Candidatus Parcubacteria bacterium]